MDKQAAFNPFIVLKNHYSCVYVDKDDSCPVSFLNPALPHVGGAAAGALGGQARARAISRVTSSCQHPPRSRCSLGSIPRGGSPSWVTINVNIPSSSLLPFDAPSLTAHQLDPQFNAILALTPSLKALILSPSQAATSCLSALSSSTSQCS